MFFGKQAKHVLLGAGAGIELLLFYFAILSIANSPAHAVTQFFEMWHFVLALAAGFGVQVGLYSFIRAELKAKAMAGATAEVAASGGVSAGSMVACCAHHLAEVLPLIGLSGAALFLSEYQLFFILTGVFSNIIGITMMLKTIQKHRLYPQNGRMEKIFFIDIGKARNILVATAFLALGIVFWLTTNGTL